MAVTYKKLFHMLIDRNMSPAQLQQYATKRKPLVEPSKPVSTPTYRPMCRLHLL